MTETTYNQGYLDAAIAEATAKGYEAARNRYATIAAIKGADLFPALTLELSLGTILTANEAGQIMAAALKDHPGRSAAR